MGCFSVMAWCHKHQQCWLRTMQVFRGEVTEAQNCMNGTRPLFGFQKCLAKALPAALLSTRAPVNSLAPGKFKWNFRHVIFTQILVIDGWAWGICSEIALLWMSLDFTDDQSTLVQVMAWCRQATSHYLSRCRPRSPSPYGVTRPQWVNNKVSSIDK